MKYFAASAACGSENGKALPGATGAAGAIGRRLTAFVRAGQRDDLRGRRVEAMEVELQLSLAARTGARAARVSAGRSRSSSAASCLIVADFGEAVKRSPLAGAQA